LARGRRHCRDFGGWRLIKRNDPVPVLVDLLLAQSIRRAHREARLEVPAGEFVGKCMASNDVSEPDLRRRVTPKEDGSWVRAGHSLCLSEGLASDVVNSLDNPSDVGIAH
jgi:hypothetical protein